MKKSIIIASSILLMGSALFACQRPNSEAKNPEEHSHGESSAHQSEGKAHSHGTHSHGNHAHSESHGTSESQTQVKLLSDAAVPSQTEIPLLLQVQDKAGEAVADFEVFQEKLMHLIVVSEDLQTYQHLHPTYAGDGKFEVSTQLPKGGSYTLFSDYKPKGLEEQVSAVSIQATGEPATPPEPDFSRTQTLENTQVLLQQSASTLKSGQSVELTFNLLDSDTQTPATDLQPYLGSLGHLVIVKQSSALSRADYLHAHALPSTEAGSVAFHTAFPEPGLYKAWGQFQRNNQLLTSSFWFMVKD